MNRRMITLAGAVLLLLGDARAWALRPDQIALIVNDRVNGSRALAIEYARARQIPDGRIISVQVDSPNPDVPQEEIPFVLYEHKIAQPVRQFLEKNGLKDQVTCLVSFWGVPLRIAPIPTTPALKQEQIDLESQQSQALKQVDSATSQLETLAKKLDSGFYPATQPAQIKVAFGLVNRANAAISRIIIDLQAMPAGKERSAFVGQLTELTSEIWGKLNLTIHLSEPAWSGLLDKPLSPDSLADAQKRILDTDKQVLSLGMDSAESRATIRQITRDNLGLINLLAQIDEELSYVRTDQTDAATDSELAALWWKSYPRYFSQPNPLYIRYAGPQISEPTLMVTRIDAPTLDLAHQLIRTSIEVEKKGLQGIVALDARGLDPKDSYGKYDQTLRNLSDLIRRKTQLTVKLDNRPELFPAHSLSNIALYCGWHSLRNYVPPGSFAPGAVGFHAASFELIRLHAQNETGWVHGLMNDGVVATIGPVQEPYLESWPRADDFFSLLLTGQLTLAEVYWRTTPMLSWMQDCIGDPLYCPYAANPQLTAGDLPAVLRPALQNP